MPENTYDTPQNRRKNDAKMEALEHRIDELTKTVDAMNVNIKDLVEAWNTAQGVTKFVKWLSGIIIAVVGIIAVFKGGK